MDVAITGGYVVPVDGEPIDGGTVLIRDGKIAAVGTPADVDLPDGVDDTDVARRAFAAGLAPVALSGLSIAHHPGHGLMLGFTNVREEDAPAFAARLVAIVGKD